MCQFWRSIECIGFHQKLLRLYLLGKPAVYNIDNSK